MRAQDLYAAGYRAKAELANPYVKIAVIADIHANLNALEAVLQDAERQRNNCFSKCRRHHRVRSFSQTKSSRCYTRRMLLVLIGNFDLEVLDKNNRGKGPKKFALEYARKDAGKSLRNLSSHLTSPNLSLKSLTKNFS